MSELVNFPVVNQLTDGDVNASWDCVPASIAAGLEFLTGNHYTAGQIKDNVYGSGYIGGTAAYMYVTYCAEQGVRLSPINGSYQYLLDQAHQALASGMPVLFTEVDPYMPASTGDTHVCVWWKDDSVSLTAMDPFGGKMITQSDNAWSNVLQFNQIWTMQKMGVQTSVPNGWHDDGNTLTAPNGVSVILGFRQYVLSHTWHPDNWPLDKEAYPNQLEVGNPSLGGGSQQIFRWTVLEWTPQRGVFEMWTGQEILALRAMLAKLYQSTVK